MDVSIITFCLVGAVFSNPILYTVILEQNGHETINTTLSVSSSQSSESDTSELQSSEENTSNQSSKSESLESTSEDTSSKSESLESTSEDTTSEEIDSQSLEELTDSHGETRDNSLGSEENVRRQGWIHVYANVIKALSAEDNSSTEIQSQTDHLEDKPSQKHPSDNSSISLGRAGNTPAESNSTLLLVESQTKDSGETSDSSDTSDSADITDQSITTKSSESSSSESSDTSETSEDTSETSEDTSESSESNASDSTELKQIKSKDCLEGIDSTACESEEYFFQNIGDDGHHPSDLLMVPDEDHRELNLRR